uniref:Leucine zipper transcription factor-like protein 1 n=1 Tax=Plectus sambesii TaxID=2011161 RepID=A0A914UQG5_9BILA
MSEQGELGLNEHHQDQLVQFLRFARYQRGQRMRAVEAVFKETKKSRLNDSTFTKDEVIDLLKGLEKVLSAELESELLNSSHTGLLLLRQLCGQAEKWHLKLYADLSELENRELLDAVQKFEEDQFDMAKKNKRPSISVLRRLEPIEGSGVAPLLQTEIERLRAENDRLNKKFKASESGALGVVSEKEALRQQLEQAKNAEPRVKIVEKDNTAAIDELNSKLNQMSGKMSAEVEASKNAQRKLEEDLINAQKRLLAIQEQLEMKEAELDKKFSQTATYKNMKQMLNKKNKQMKEIRAKLSSYEPSTGADADDD